MRGEPLDLHTDRVFTGSGIKSDWTEFGGGPAGVVFRILAAWTT